MSDSDERLRTISLLQQKAHTLEVEVAERRAAEGRVRASELRYRRLFEASTDGILLVDPDTQTVMDANPVMADLLGYAHGQLLDRELWKIGLFPDKHSTLAALRELEQKHLLRYESVPLQTSDGQRRYGNEIHVTDSPGSHSLSVGTGTLPPGPDVTRFIDRNIVRAIWMPIGKPFAMIVLRIDRSHHR